MDHLVPDLRLALRGLRRAPTFTVAAVLVLGLGIGMSVAMWTVFDAVLLRRLPVSSPDHIVLPRALNQARADIALSHHDVDQLRHGTRTMSEISAFEHFGAYQIPKLDGERPLPLLGTQVDGRFFEVLGAKPVLGRLLRPDDDSTSYVMVLSYDAWQRYFGGDSSVIGRRFRQPQLNVTYSIVGVAPPGIDFPAGTDYWEPLAYPGLLDDIIGRLAPNASLASAKSEFLDINRQIDHQRPGAPNNVRSADIRTFDSAVVGDVRPVLILLVVAVALLLLISCVNVGNLLLLRAITRSHEFAIRRALGATPGDVARQLLLETALLALAGGTLGLVCAEVGRRLLIAAAPPSLPRIDAIRLTGIPIGTAGVIALVAMVLSGILPTVTAVRRNAALPLKLDARSGSAGRQQRTVRQILVGSQVALALILLAGAGLLVRSLRRLESLDLGFRADHLSVVSVSWPLDKDNNPQLLALADGLVRQIGAIPGVTALTPIVIPPFYGPNFWAVYWQADWQTRAQAATNPAIPLEMGSADYFRTFETPILRGRGFLETDVAKSEQVAVVSQTVADRLWPGQDAIGKRLRFPGDSEPWRTVVGIAGESRFRALRDATPMVYLPYRQSYWQGWFAIRTTGDIKRLLPAIRRAISEYDPAVAVWSTRTLDDYLAAPLSVPRLSAGLLAAFGMAALLLAAVGLYGVMASVVREQTHDIGVRMALGATSARVRREVLGGALGITAVGAGVGLFVAFLSSKLLRALLFEISPTDPIALLGACVLLLGVGVGAAYLPARRATKIDPARALRAE